METFNLLDTHQIFDLSGQQTAMLKPNLRGSALEVNIGPAATLEAITRRRLTVLGSRPAAGMSGKI